MTEPVHDGTPSWAADDWETARRRKLTLALHASPAQRLAWLESAIRLAWASGALPRRRDANGQTIGGPARNDRSLHASGRLVIMSGKESDDAKKYQEAAVAEAIAALPRTPKP